MHPDLERLIRLQQLDTFVDSARRAVAEHPARVQELDARLDEAKSRLSAAQQALAANQAERRTLDKDLAAVQGRLSKFKDQLMAVKTNREYTAMLKEIEVAQQDVRRTEDRILEQMMQADELTATAKAADTRLADEKAKVRDERAALETEIAKVAAELETSLAQRQALVGEITPQVMAIFDMLSRGRKGIAVAEARDGLCTICHVRLRPQKFNDVRRNAAIVQCDSCQRILYFAGRAPAADRTEYQAES